MISNLNFFLASVLEEGIVISIVGYVIVFFALLALYGVFYYLPKLLSYNIKKKLHKEGKKEYVEKGDFQIEGGVNAAISTALFLYFEELHDEESGLITIKSVERKYSPWSSKIHGLTSNPRF